MRVFGPKMTPLPAGDGTSSPRLLVLSVQWLVRIRPSLLGGPLHLEEPI